MGKRPYGNSALSSAASCLKGFYLRQAELGVNTELAETLDKRRMPTRQDRDRALLEHIAKDMAANPLAPRRIRRRHPKMLPDGTRALLLPLVHRRGSARQRGNAYPGIVESTSHDPRAFVLRLKGRSTP